MGSARARCATGARLLTATPWVVAVAGSPAAGKTTLARGLAEERSAAVVGFGALVRAEARRRGLSPGRRALQDLGEELLGELGPAGLVAAALSEAQPTTGAPLVFDGVRHQEVLDELRARYGAQLIIVFLDPPRSARRARFAAQLGSEEAARSAEAHPSEAQVAALRGEADLVLGHARPEAVLERVLESLST